MNAKQKKAFDGGAEHKRAGIKLDRAMQNFFTTDEKCFANYGWRTQQAHPEAKVQSHFFLEHAHCKVCIAKMASTEKDEPMTLRTAEELEQLKAAYRESAYDAYAADQTAQGFEPQDFDEAFAAHLAALDEAGATDPAPTAEDTATVGVKPASTAGKKGAKTAAAKAEKPAKAAKAPAEPKEPKPKKFRPTSEDRAAIMAAAGKLTKDETPRLLLADGSPYVDFLKGTTMDADGNLEVGLKVFTAKGIRAEKPEPVGALKVTIKKGAFSKVVKA